MFGYLFLVCFMALLSLSVGSVIHANEIFEEKQLVLAFFINRHGERTPDADELSLSNEKDRIRNLTRLEGLEGLTNMGKRRAYQLGKFIRQRYGAQGLNLISNLYLPDEIAVRSTDKERTKMTALVAMSAVYPPEVEQQWDENIGKVWQPVPYSAVPLSQDYLRYYSNCKRFKAVMAKELDQSKDFLPYEDLLPILLAETGRNFTEEPLLFETLFDLFRSQVGLGLDIPEWATPILPRLNEAARLAYRMYFKTDEMKRIGGGVLLDQFIKAASDISQGMPVSQRLRIFSSHDFNIGSFMDVTLANKNRTIPEYGAAFALELYKSSKGEFSVVPIYLNQGGDSTHQVLTIDDCGQPCDLYKFILLTKKFTLPENQYQDICGN